uniref:Uncharacterized protein n=1 Tax=Kalanchoe fedtschenkoi TaxID=63787 RepID=A0A7N0VME3_KALFE
MAASATMQSILAPAAAQWPTRAGLPSRARAAPRSMVVKCSAKQEGPKEASASSANPATPPPLPSNSTIKPTMSPSAPKVSTKFSDVLAFDGPAPERINGRLAMLGFVSAMAVELSSGQDVFSQISNGGVPLFLASSVVLSIASLVPLFKGVSVQSKSDGLMTSDAELWNGRFAMLGLVALAFTEFVKGGALV